MRINDVVTLISENPEAHGVLDAAQSTEREVFCTVRSVGMREAYEAMAVGLSPELVLVIPHDFEYAGEKCCSFHGVAYDIIRTYVTDADGIELTIQRREGNAR